MADEPAQTLEQAIAAIRIAQNQLQEQVVQSIMRRNRLQEDLKQKDARLNLLMSKLPAQTGQADSVADTLRAEVAMLRNEMEPLRKAAEQAAAEAESMRISLPDRRADMERQITQLRARAVQTAAESAPPALDLSDMEKNADRMLAELEQKMVQTPTGQTSPESVMAPEAPPVQITETLAPPVLESLIHENSAPAAEPETRPQPLAQNGAKPRIRIAAIGTGSIFRGAHLPAHLEMEHSWLAALCDPDPDALQSAMKRMKQLVEEKCQKAIERGDTETADRLREDLKDVRLCSSLQEVIDTVQPDLADICTQPNLHVSLSIQALQAGIHVMCEKPVSRSWLETERLIDAQMKSGRFYQHNENWLFEPEYYTVRKLVQAGAIGDLVSMFLTQAHGGPENRAPFWNPDFGGGGSLLDNGIHAIGAAWFVAGLDWQPVQVRAANPFGMSIRMPQRILDGRYQTVTVDDDAHILILFENPANGAWCTAHVEGSWSHQDSPDTVYIGSTGRIEMGLQDGKRVAVIYDAAGNTRTIAVSGPNWVPWPSSFYGEILNMVQCIRAGVPSLMTPQFGADCSAIVGAAYLSEKQGRKAVSPEEFRQFARSIAASYPGKPAAADDALVNSLLEAVRNK